VWGGRLGDATRYFDFFGGELSRSHSRPPKAWQEECDCCGVSTAHVVLEPSPHVFY
jgi:hypothetical protein